MKQEWMVYTTFRTTVRAARHVELSVHQQMHKVRSFGTVDDEPHLGLEWLPTRGTVEIRNFVSRPLHTCLLAPGCYPATILTIPKNALRHSLCLRRTDTDDHVIERHILVSVRGDDRERALAAFAEDVMDRV